MGLVSQVFDGNILHHLVGHTAVGHTRYSTTGSSLIQNAQPLTAACARGQIAVGAQRQSHQRRPTPRRNSKRGSIFQTTVDTKIIVHLLAQPNSGNAIIIWSTPCGRLEGAYSLAILTEHELIGVRDPHGFRPLSLGQLGDAGCSQAKPAHWI